MRSLGRRPSRPGTSIVELLVALVLLGIVAGGALRALDRQARLHGALLAMLESRVLHAATHETVASMLRGVAPRAGDIVALSDSAVAARITIGGGVACLSWPTRIVLAPDTIAGGHVLTHLTEPPQPGDSLWVLDEGPTDASIDDAWRAAPVVGAFRSPGACTGTPLLGAGDASRNAWTVDVGAVLPGAPSVGPGSPVRLTRRARLALYRSGPDSWLGFAEWNFGSGSWNVIQPVSGPYLHYSSAAPSMSGVALVPRDSNGTTSSTGPVASIGLATRTRSRAVSLQGSVRAPLSDSLHSVIALRNAR
jgi:hypothetical protein